MRNVASINKRAKPPLMPPAHLMLWRAEYYAATDLIVIFTADKWEFPREDILAKPNSLCSPISNASYYAQAVWYCRTYVWRGTIAWRLLMIA